VAKIGEENDWVHPEGDTMSLSFLQWLKKWSLDDSSDAGAKGKKKLKSY
jgi:hypothetical protein